MIVSLLYVSTARLDAADTDRAIAKIVARARVDNARRAITGMLLFANGRFAQLLEGEASEVAALMARIEKDARHGDLRIVLRDQRDARRLPAWTMGYAGPSSYIAGHIEPVFAAIDPQMLRRASLRLIDLMIELSRHDMSTNSKY